jgi:hypothetical protein
MKRRHKRYSITGSADLTYTIKGNNEVIHALISDIAISGIGLYSDILIEENVDVSLDIIFISSEGITKTDATEGRIVYIRQLKNIYFMGIEFHEEITSRKQPSLYGHLQTVSLLNFYIPHHCYPVKVGRFGEAS